MELTTPVATSGTPSPGIRVIQTEPEYAGTSVHHTLYLPTDWDPGWAAGGLRYPVIVEYTGNYHPTSGSTDRVEDANLAYGLTGGRGCIWVVMPSVDTEVRENAVLWWGNIEATVNYCKTALARVCSNYGGDTENLFICGFSRGGIAASQVGLYDEEIAGLWRGFYAHDGLHGAGDWPFEGGDAVSAGRLAVRLRGRSVLVSWRSDYGRAREILGFIEDHNGVGNFSLLPVPVDEILQIPGDASHPHTDLWMHNPSEYRDSARAWLRQVSDY